MFEEKSQLNSAFACPGEKVLFLLLVQCQVLDIRQMLAYCLCVFLSQYFARGYFFTMSVSRRSREKGRLIVLIFLIGLMPQLLVIYSYDSSVL